MELLTEFAAPGFQRVKPYGLLMPYRRDPRLAIWCREGYPPLTFDGRPVKRKNRTLILPDGRIIPMIEGAAASTYIIFNAALATTAAPVKQPTGSTIRTMMQLSTQNSPSTMARIIEWGCSFDASAAATPGQVELFDTTVAATGLSTAYAAADVQPYSNSNAPANTASTTGVPLALGTSNSGFATAGVTEGTVANYRAADLQMIAPTGQYVKQWPLGREFEIPGNHYLRTRVTFGATVNMYGYILIET